MVHRVRVAKDKSEFVRGLVGNETDGASPFQTYADLLAFAAALGMKRQQKSPVREVSNREPAPIALEIFLSRGYDRLFNLLTAVETRDPALLSPTNAEARAARVALFEEYANGGLEILQAELRGAIDYGERLLLIMLMERHTEDPHSSGFDLQQFA
ncbi:DNA phosphorothioation-associated protein 4 [Baaleninema sp.]|uniref:DNA phosphorothioation-associated protein 4 n=1 Tax=Baaleninema sp. TaxID=3101197 RepID=UPI003CFF4627